AKRSKMLDPDVVHAVLGGVRMFGLVVAADAQVVVRETGQVIREAQRLIERDRIVQLPVDKEVVAGRLEGQRFRARSGGQRDIQVRCVVRVHAEQVDVEGAFVLDQRSAQAEAVV